MNSFEVAATGNMANMIRLMGVFYKTIFSAVDQPVENARDAGATEIHAIIEHGKYTVIDNGRGMVGQMLPEDRKKFQEWQRKSSAGELTDSDEDNIKKILPRDCVSRNSLEYMVSSIGGSSKDPADQDTMGFLGIGSVAYLRYAEQQVIITRAHIDLARQFWGNDLQPSDEYTVCLYGLSKKSLEAGKLKCSIDLQSEPLVDFDGKPMEHGTRVEITGIPERSKVYDISGLIAHLRDRFGEDIRQGKYRLFVVDRVSSEARKKGGQIIHEVTPKVYTGVCLIREKAHVEGGAAFDIDIWYDQTGQSPPVMVTLKGSEKAALKDLSFDELKVWAIPGLTGRVAYPNYGHADRLWTPDKNDLLDTEPTRKWIRRLADYAERVRSQVENHKERFREENYRELATDIASSLAEAMKQLDGYKGYLPQVPTYPAGAVPTGTKPEEQPPIDTIDRPPRDASVAAVKNEHNDGVSEVSIELWRLDKKKETRLETKITGISGNVSFGRLDPGIYEWRITVPQGVKVLSSGVHRFRITDKDKRHYWTFRVFTNEPKRPRKKLTALNLRLVPFNDRPDLPYRANMDVGRIEINIIHPDFREAEESGDINRLDLLCAEYASAASTEYCLEGEPTHNVMLHHCSLVLRTFQSLSQRKKNRRRSQPVTLR